jgi:hypothetical protein
VQKRFFGKTSEKVEREIEQLQLALEAKVCARPITPRNARDS